MTKFEQVVQIVMEQLEMNRESIDHHHAERMTIEVKFRPHGGPPRSALTYVLHVRNDPMDNQNASEPNGVRANRVAKV